MLDDVAPGQVLGRYELLLPIAKGGMAMVWAARLKGSRGFQKLVAIKTMLPGMIDDPNFERMFLDEASLASQVRHPHVVEIHDLGEQAGVPYIVMEWVDGEPLNVILHDASKRGGIPLPIGVAIVAQACRGLHAAHELRDEDGELVGLVHRDVSPQNVIVTYDGVVKVVDFGVAKATSRVAAETEAGQLKGKIAYMAPEQLCGDPVDRRADVFALGILLYMVTTGIHPFRGENLVVTMSQITGEDAAEAPRELIADYPASLEAVVMRALAKRVDDRFSSANELLKALSQALPGSTPMATDEEVAEFLRDLLGDRLEKRRLAIRAALDLADGRPHGDSLLPLESRPGDDIHTVVHRPSVPTLTPSRPFFAEPTSASLAKALGDPDLSLSGVGASNRISDAWLTPRRRWVPAAVALGLAGALAALSLVAWQRRNPDLMASEPGEGFVPVAASSGLLPTQSGTGGLQAEHTASVTEAGSGSELSSGQATVISPASSEPSGTDAPEVDQVASSPSVPEQTVHKKRPHRPRRKAAARHAPNHATGTQAGAKTSDVSPIRDPGF